MHMHILKMPPIRQLWQYILQGDHDFLLVERMLLTYSYCLVSPSLFTFCLATQTLSVEALPFGLATAPRVFTSLPKPILFSAIKRVYVLLFIWMISWSLLNSRHAGKRVHTFLCSIGLSSITYLFSQVCTLYHTAVIFSGTVLGYSGQFPHSG